MLSIILVEQSELRPCLRQDSDSTAIIGELKRGLARTGASSPLSKAS
jgi:hypothetical protein